MRIMLFIFCLFMLLTSCANSCFMAFAVTECYDESKVFPSIAVYQKSNSIGHTDTKQRWVDAASCGARYGDENIIFINGMDWRNNSREERERIINSFRYCMNRKGYVRIPFADCYKQGICNY